MNLSFGWAFIYEIAALDLPVPIIASQTLIMGITSCTIFLIHDIILSNVLCWSFTTLFTTKVGF